MIKKIYVRIRIFILCIKWIFRITLGDSVKYKGNKYIVHNGVRKNSWRIEPSKGLPNDGWVKRSECSKIWSIKGIIRSFKSANRFYYINWYSIWIKTGIKKWKKDIPSIF